MLLIVDYTHRLQEKADNAAAREEEREIHKGDKRRSTMIEKGRRRVEMEGDETK